MVIKKVLPRAHVKAKLATTYAQLRYADAWLDAQYASVGLIT
jgi:hypothetical protein